MSRRLFLLLVLLVVLVVPAAGAASEALSEAEPVQPSAPGTKRAPTPDASRSGAGAASLDGGPPLGQTPVLDNFNRPDGPLGPNWSSFYSSGTLSIQSNVVRASGGLATSYWTADEFGPDQEAYYYDAGSLDVNLGNLRLFVRLTDPDADGGWNGYQLINHRLITGCYWYLWRLDDGATTYLANQVPNQLLALLSVSGRRLEHPGLRLVQQGRLDASGGLRRLDLMPGREESVSESRVAARSSTSSAAAR